MTGAPDSPHIGEASLALARAHRGVTPVPSLSRSLPELTLDDAYEIQQRQVVAWIADGAVITGRKVGLTSPAVQRQLGVDQPDFGTLLDRMAVPDDGTIPAGLLIQPKVEAEVALVLGRDVLAPCTMAELSRAVDLVLPALEIVDSRITNWDISLVDTVADNASSGRYVLGATPCALSDVNLPDIAMTLWRDGVVVSRGVGADCLGSPLNAALWLANELASRGTPLCAGDVVLTGALGPMAAAEPGNVFEARISGLGSVRVAFGEKAS